jgi:hypothetical protein
LSQPEKFTKNPPIVLASVRMHDIAGSGRRQQADEPELEVMP